MPEESISAIRPLSKEDPFSMGHMTELNIRNTRLASDEVNVELVPVLAQKLASGELKLKDATKINDVYFRQAGIAGSDGNKSFLIDEKQSGTVNGIFSAKREHNDEGVRTSNVYNATFHHADAKTAQRIAPKLFDELNKFVANTPNMDDLSIECEVGKFYLLFSALHIPQDGSGRFSGDLDTVIQEAIRLKLKENGREFNPTLISSNGWRKIGSGYETDMMNEEKSFNRSLIRQEVIPRMLLANPDLVHEMGYDDKYSFEVIGQDTNERMKTFVDKLNSNREFKRLYLNALDESIESLIDIHYDSIPSDPKDWFHGKMYRIHSTRAKGRKTHNKYVPTSEIGEKNAEIVDTLMAHCINGNFDLFLNILGDNSKVSEYVLSKHDVSPVVHALLKRASGSVGKNILAKAISSNPDVTRLAKKTGVIT